MGPPAPDTLRPFRPDFPLDRVLRRASERRWLAGTGLTSAGPFALRAVDSAAIGELERSPDVLGR